MRLTLVILVSTLLYGCASGSAVVTGQVRPSLSPDQVQIYTTAPEHYEVIGEVQATSEVQRSVEAADMRVLEELKAQAAQLGANGILIKSSSTDSKQYTRVSPGHPFFSGEIRTRTATGEAIHVAD